MCGLSDLESVLRGNISFCRAYSSLVGWISLDAFVSLFESVRCLGRARRENPPGFFPERFLRAFELFVFGRDIVANCNHLCTASIFTEK